MDLPRVDGPTDLPGLRDWMLSAFRPGGVLDSLDGAYIRTTMRTAHLWWVEAETCALLSTAAPSVPDDLTLDVADIPSKAGFAVFAEPIPGTDAETGEPMEIAAICWGPVHLPLVSDSHNYADSGRIGLGIGMFSRYDLHKGLNDTELRRAAPHLAMLDTFGLTAQVVWEPDEYAHAKYDGNVDGEPIELDVADMREHGKVIAVTAELRGPFYCYLGRTDWLHGAAVGDIIPDAPRRGVPAVASMREDRQLLASLWAITRTPFVTSVRERPPRHVARRSERKNLTADVRVLRLGGPHRENLPTGNTSTERAREWQHSWIVGAHHRWQACGPGWSQRKLILVMPYRKGPEDKPLLGGERVWRVVPPVPRSEP